MKQKTEYGDKKTTRLTMAMENCLLSIIHLEEQDLPVAPAGLANQLETLTIWRQHAKTND